MNRLSKWSVASFGVVTVRLAGDKVTSEETPPPVYALHLELDINTVPEFKGQIPKAKLATVYRELVDLGLEIAARGLIPE